jgi:hypothetical protein
MKIKFAFLFILFTTINSSVFAKTQGTYIGFDILKNSLEFSTRPSLDIDNQGDNQKLHNIKTKNFEYGIGANLKYAFNFYNFFIAPGIAFEYLNNEKNTSSILLYNLYYSQSTILKSASSFKTSIGYDFNKFSIYIPFGISAIDYSITTRARNDGSIIGSLKRGFQPSYFKGIGISYELNKNLIANLEYNKYNNFNLKISGVTINNRDIKTATKLDIIKFGLAYKF